MFAMSAYFLDMRLNYFSIPVFSTLTFIIVFFILRSRFSWFVYFIFCFCFAPILYILIKYFLFDYKHHDFLAVDFEGFTFGFFFLYPHAFILLVIGLSVFLLCRSELSAARISWQHISVVVFIVCVHLVGATWSFIWSMP